MPVPGSRTLTPLVAEQRTGRAQWALRRSLLPLLALLLTLTACSVEPRLHVDADDLTGGAYSADTITVRNAGGGVLRWQFSSDNPHVTLRHHGEAVVGGQLSAGASARYTIDVAGALRDPAVGLNATLNFSSNGGSRSVRYATTTVGVCSPQRALAPGHEPEPVGNEILVSYHLSSPSGAALTGQSLAVAATAARGELLATYGLSTLEAADGHGPDLLVAPAHADVDALVARLAADPLVAAVQRNYYVQPLWNGGTPTNAYFHAQWALSSFGVPEAWAALDTPPQREVVLAILDTGVATDHPELAGKTLPGYDFYRNAPEVQAPWLDTGHASYGQVAHGTHVAGIAAAAGIGAGTIGVAFAPEVKLLPVKLFDDCGASGRVDVLVKAIRWAAGLQVPGAPPNPHKAHVINMSLGLAKPQPVLDQATDEAWAAGVLLIAAAGNHRPGASSAVLSPANGTAVLAVGSVDQNRARSGFSNYGPELDLMAPGGYPLAGSPAAEACAGSSSVSVLSTVPLPPGAALERGYGCMAGTSMAAPFVAGVAAMLLANDATLTSADVRQRLLASAHLEPHMLASPREYGAGLVCADAVLGASTRCGAP